MAPDNTEQKAPKGAPRGNNSAETHGHYKRKVKLSSVSFDDINKSSAGGWQLDKRRRELLKHAGGEQSAGVVKIRNIQQICFLERDVDEINLYLVKLGPKIIDRKNKSVIPIILQRNSMLATLDRLYKSIGYQPKAPSTTRFVDYVKSKERAQ